MKKKLLRFILFLSLMVMPFSLSAQDESPVVVSQPKVSVTVFTNWQLIEVVYTVGYLNGYKVLTDRATPENMSFGFETDPERGVKLEIRNQRKFNQENYADFVYYLRRIAEEKGDMVIPEQVFQYVKEEPGKSLEGFEVHDVKAPGVMMRYDSVLTKGANDIMDEIDFGSFKRQEYWLKGTAFGLVGLLLFFISALLLFWKPVKSSKAKKPAKAKKADGSAGESEEEIAVRPLPKEALESFEQFLVLASFRLKLDESACREVRVDLANNLRQLLGSYTPEILDSDTPKEIRQKVSAAEPSREKETLCELASLLILLDLALFGQVNEAHLVAQVKSEIRSSREAYRKLKLAGSFWRRLFALLVRR